MGSGKEKNKQKNQRNQWRESVKMYEMREMFSHLSIL